jgi:hypothetical protein
MNKQKNIIIGILSVFLLLAGFDGWPYDFFVFLRFVVCASAVYLAWLAYKEKQEKRIWAYGIVAVLFNPFFPLHFGRSTWVIIDIVTSIFLIASAFLFKPINKEIENSEDDDLNSPLILYKTSQLGISNNIKIDPKETDSRYKEIIKRAGIEAEKIVTQKNPDMVIGKCVLVWMEQKRILKEKHKIDWKSPGELNRDANFD